MSDYNKPFPKGIYEVRITGYYVPDILFSIRTPGEQNGTFPFRYVNQLNGNVVKQKIIHDKKYLPEWAKFSTLLYHPNRRLDFDDFYLMIHDY